MASHPAWRMLLRGGPVRRGRRGPRLGEPADSPSRPPAPAGMIRFQTPHHAPALRERTAARPGRGRVGRVVRWALVGLVATGCSDAVGPPIPASVAISPGAVVLDEVGASARLGAVA